MSLFFCRVWADGHRTIWYRILSVVRAYTAVATAARSSMRQASFHEVAKGTLTMPGDARRHIRIIRRRVQSAGVSHEHSCSTAIRPHS
jgi:hypothetical protein